MKDEQALEEKLMAVLDRMYRHVADLENGPGPVEHHHNPNEDGQMSDQEFLPHAKIIPFPGNRIHVPSEELSEASEEELKRKSKRSYRTYLIVGSFSVFFLAFVLVILLSNVMIGRRSSEKGQPQQVTFPIYLKPSPPLQRQESVLHTIEQGEPQAETKPQQTVESEFPPHQIVEPQSPFTKTKSYAVQVGAFLDWENASKRIVGLRKKNLEPYWIEMQSKKSKTIYVIFSGFFTDRNEAVKFMKGKDIRKTYPGSFVHRISF
jgi:cell division septation protein DedD